MTTKKERPRIHFTPGYFNNPAHPISIDLVGCGGNGSIILSCLASMHTALKALGMTGLSVTAYDEDTVSEANMGRQLFTINDLEVNKAVALTTRFNRCFALDWKAVPEKYKYNPKTNIIITCTDNVASRKLVSKFFKKYMNEKESTQEFANYYWLDLGNTQNTGQAVLGSRDIPQPTMSKYETVNILPCITDLHKLSEKDEKKSGPSCSLAEALNRQDLFINRSIATEAADILWKLLRNGHIQIHGFYKNLESMRTVPIEV